jgi:hypothetical protein
VSIDHINFTNKNSEENQTRALIYSACSPVEERERERANITIKINVKAQL